MNGEGKVVCVTGASGYIASWLVKRLLQRGYTVKATVRDTSDPKKTQHLLALDGAKERLHLFKADLLDEGSFGPVVEGCEGVFHTASPAFLSSSDPQVELIDPAVKGTLNVLQACSKVPSIRRVVLTSSMASVLLTGRLLTPDVVVDETWSSDLEVCKNSKSWYHLSKTLAEQAAWNFANENGLDLVSLHPAVVIGPLLQPALNSSVEVLLSIITATGRYCLVGRAVHVSEVLKMLKNLYPTLELVDSIPVEPACRVSRERAQTLGINFIPLEVSVKDTVESLKKKGFLNL